MQVYKHAKTENDCDIIIKKLKKSYGSDSTSLTLWDALFHPRYRRATWTTAGYIWFHELTGTNVIVLYST